MAPRRPNISLRQPHTTRLGVPETSDFWRGKGGHTIVRHEGVLPGGAEVHHVAVIPGGRGSISYHYAVSLKDVQSGLRLEIKPRRQSSITGDKTIANRINEAAQAVRDLARASGYVPKGRIEHTRSETEPKAIIFLKSKR